MIYLLVFFSGAAALVYEVVWSRQLATFLGITAWAHAAVLTAFMAGLALGSWYLGRAADRHREPLLLFGRLEVGIGLLGAASVWFVPSLQGAYVWAAAGQAPGGALAHALRFSMALAALLLPTFLMGGTLPALVRGLNRELPRLGRSVGLLYGANTLGAAVGALAAGYLLLPVLGLRRTALLAVGLNFFVAIWLLTPLARFLVRPGAARPGAAQGGRAEVSTRAYAPAVRLRVLVGFAASGFAALTLQLVWVRALTLVLGSSVYAFSLTLAAYLFGIGLGSLLFVRFLDRLAAGARLVWAGWLQVAVGFTALLGLPVIGALPGIFVAGYRAGVQESFPRLQLFAFVLASSVVLVPTLLMGVLFPLVTTICSVAGNRVGRDVGTAYAANSAGTVLGATVGGVFVLPWLGVHDTLIAVGGLYVVIGGVFWMLSGWGVGMRRGLRRSMLALAAFSVLALLLPPWDRTVMTSGPFINASRIIGVPEGESFRQWLRLRSNLLFYREGADGTVTVRDVGEERLLAINGKTDGSRIGDRKTQVTIGHLPLLAHPSPRDVLVIGLGTGMTAASAATHDSVERLTVVEISPEVIAASDFFAKENRDILQDPRLELVRADARNYLLTQDRRWDVIIAEPSNPWISGVSNLFTREFFELAAGRLGPDGVMAQWFQTYGMSTEDWRSLLATFRQLFPEVSVWMPQMGDLVLIGSRDPHRLDLGHLRELLASPLGLADLLPARLLGAPDFARMLLLSPRDVEEFSRGAALNTDDLPRVEFNAARNLYAETTMANVVEAVDFLDGQPSQVPLSGLGSLDATGMFRAFGLAIAAGPALDPVAEWLVTWTAARPAEADALPRIAVGNRRVISFASDGRHIEVQCGVRAAAPDVRTSLDDLFALAPGEISGWGNLDRDPEALPVWVEGSTGEGLPFVGLAWSCGENAEGFSSYVAFEETVPGGSTEPSPAALSRWFYCAASSDGL